MRLLAAIVFLLLTLLPAQAQQGLSQALVVSSCGALALTVGGQVQATMDTTGRLCSHKTGSGVSPPVNSAAPVASGLLPVGSTLSCTNGTWTNSPTSYAYKWLRGGSAISGATAATYVTVTADGGTAVGCAVQATNAGGSSAFVNSNTLAIAAAGGCVAATNYLSRTSGGNEGGNAANITTLICGLVTDGVITGNLSGTIGGCGTFFDVLYIFAQQVAADSRLNLCGTTYTATPTGTPTFTALRGYTFTSAQNLDTGFNPATATTPKFVQNSAAVGVWSDAVTADAGCEIGQPICNGAGQSGLMLDFGSGWYVRINDGGGGAISTPGVGASGFYVGDRSASTTSIPYFNGVAQTSVTSTSAAPASNNFTINVIGQSTTQTLSEASISASLGASLELKVYTRFRTYNTAVGVP